MPEVGSAVNTPILKLTESERWLPVIGWGAGRLLGDPGWTATETGETAPAGLDTEAPAGHDWVAPWRLFEPWEYARCFSGFTGRRAPSRTDCVRRRVWVRAYHREGVGLFGGTRPELTNNCLPTCCPTPSTRFCQNANVY